MDIEAIVFDLDGVLLDSEKAWQGAIKKTAEEMGGSWKRRDRDAMDRHLPPEAWSAWIKERSDLAASPEEIHAAVLDNLILSFETSLPLNPGAGETVRALSDKYPLALATGSDRVVVDAFLDLSGLQEYFSLTLAAEDTVRAKPNPEIYEKAVYLLDQEAERTLAVEDSTAGIASALAAGLPTICYLDERYPAENLDQVRLVLRDLNALSDLLLWPSVRS